MPYRDRAQHLARFVPHMITYFERDKLDRQTRSLSTSSSRRRARRCRNAGYEIERRDGTYIPLKHPHAGFGAGGNSLTFAGMLTTTQCQNPDPVGASGS